MTSLGVMASAVNVSSELLEPFNNLTAWTNLVGPPSIVAGRTGTAAQMTSAQSAEYRIPAALESATVTTGFAWQTTSLIAQIPLGLKSDAGATTHVRIQVNADGSLTARQGTVTTLGVTATGLIAAINTWYYIEVQCTLSDTVGIVTLRVNGTQVLALTAKDTKNAGTKTTFDTVQIGGASAVTGRFDDMYITMGPAAVFKGSISIT